MFFAVLASFKLALSVKQVELVVLHEPPHLAQILQLAQKFLDCLVCKERVRVSLNELIISTILSSFSF